MTSRPFPWILRAVGMVGLAVLTVAPVWAPQAAADSVGVSPTDLTFDQALRGGSFEKLIAVFTNSETSKNFSFEKAGEVAPWLTFFDGNGDPNTQVDHVVAPPKGKDGYVGVRLDVPQPTPNGTYQGTITVYSTNAAEGTAGAANVGAEVAVTVRVTGTQVVAGSLVEASLPSAQLEVGETARFGARVQNDGNVDLAPDVTVVVRSRGADVGTVAAEPSPIPPAGVANLEARWDTHRFEVGDYTAEVTATAGGTPLGTRTVNFTLVPEGTLNRRGEIRELRVDAAPSVGGAGRVVAVFANTGAMGADATFHGELWRGNQLVGPVSSAELRVEPGNSGDLAFVVPTPNAGSYRLTGTVNYSGKETAASELAFQVGDDSGVPTAVWVAVGLAALGLAVLLVRRLRRRGV